MKTAIIVLLIALIFSFSVSAEEITKIIIDRFDSDLSAWDVQEFNGKTDYTIVTDSAGHKVLSASSRASASALIQYVNFYPNDYPLLSWRWKIDSINPKGDVRTKQGDDYPARIYVVFPHWIKPLSRTINYIWSNKLAQGRAVPSSYFSRSMMLAVESGQEKAGQWVIEERNIVDDYRMLFGEDPPKVGGIAIMTDTDDTGGNAQAWYDDLIFSPSN
jgi:Protein of unknown function (DUF3047)